MGNYYIIDNQRLVTIIHKYLDTMGFFSEINLGRYLIFSEDKRLVAEYSTSQNHWEIKYKYFTNLVNMFSLERYELLEIIKSWISNKIGLPESTHPTLNFTYN